MFLKTASTATPISRISTKVKKTKQNFEGSLVAAALIYSQNRCPHGVRLSKLTIKCPLVFRKGYVVAELHLGKVGKVAKNGLETEV